MPAAATKHPLERLLAPLDATPLWEPTFRESERPEGAHVAALATSAEPRWLHAGMWRLFARTAAGAPGEPLAEFQAAGGERLAVVRGADGVVTVPFELAGAYTAYVGERWREVSPPLALKPWQFAIFYRVKRLIPRSAQLAARRALMRRQGTPEFPRWPLDLSVERLVRLLARCLLAASGRDELPFRWFWPRPYRYAAILTHDVESAEGLRLALELANLEEERGLRSSFNVVADWYPIDDGILRELRGRGFEIGVHGVRHDRSMFSSRAAFEAQQPAVRAAAERFEAVGFRSPATHRVFDWLADLPVSYDCSVPNSDPYDPQPGGCCSPWPFFVGDVVELPYTLPQDHTLFTLLRHRSIDLWLEQIAELRRCGGLVQALTHPDPGYLGDPDKRALYAAFLDALRDDSEAWLTLPRDVAAWWRDRDRGESERFELATGRIRRDDSEDGVVLEP